MSDDQPNLLELIDTILARQTIPFDELFRFNVLPSNAEKKPLKYLLSEMFSELLSIKGYINTCDSETELLCWNALYQELASFEWNYETSFLLISKFADIEAAFEEFIKKNNINTSKSLDTSSSKSFLHLYSSYSPHSSL